MGLLYDIFPGVDPPRQRDLSFEDTVRHTAVELGLEPEEEFVRQVVQVSKLRYRLAFGALTQYLTHSFLPLSWLVLQLSELLAIRHCVFLMGPTGTGKFRAANAGIQLC